MTKGHSVSKSLGWVWLPEGEQLTFDLHELTLVQRTSAVILLLCETQIYWWLLHLCLFFFLIPDNSIENLLNSFLQRVWKPYYWNCKHGDLSKDSGSHTARVHQAPPSFLPSHLLPRIPVSECETSRNADMLCVYWELTWHFSFFLHPSVKKTSRHTPI